ncbi:hypothetical protein BH23PLA1_BH23PLA1_43500 [soil metagenome]
MIRGINWRVRGTQEQAKGVANKAAYHVAWAMEATFPVRRLFGSRPPDHWKVASFSRPWSPASGNSGHACRPDRPNSEEIPGTGAIAPIEKAGLKKGPLFRARRHWRKPELSTQPIAPVTMYTLLQGYLVRLPGAVREEELVGEDGTVRKVRRCLYTPHSIRATTATLLLDAGVDIIKVKELLGHRHVTTTQIYDKRRRSAKEGASHDVPI